MTLSDLTDFANRLIPRSPPGTAQRVKATYPLIDNLRVTLPSVPLRPGELSVLGGHTFARTPSLVFRVSFGMRRNPDLFPDVPFCADDLDQVQDEACAWGQVANDLRNLTRVAEENQIRAQAQAVGMARTVLAQVKGGCEQPRLAPTLDHRSRVVAMMRAFDLTSELHDNKKATAARKRAGKAAPPAPSAAVSFAPSALATPAGSVASTLAPAGSTASVAPAPAYVIHAPAPVAQTPAPVAQTPAPVAQTPAPVAQTPAPVAQAPAPVAQAPAHVVHAVIVHSPSAPLRPLTTAGPPRR